MTKHNPDRVHWNKVFRIINQNEGSIAVYDIAKELKLEKDSLFLEEAIQQLLHQGRVKIAIGKDKKGMACRVIYVVEKDTSKRSRI